MAKIEDLYVHPDLTRKLKDKGLEFVPTQKYWVNTTDGWQLNNWYITYHENVEAVLYDQVFSWFRETHNLYHVIEYILMDYGITDCRNQDIQIVKPLHTDSVLTEQQLRENTVKHLLTLI